jgi:cytochrome d ubiquinol oxidase subunit I
MEGIWHTEQGAPLVLFAIPDAETQTNRFALEIPKLASLILTHDLNGELKGINEFPGAHPPVAPVFYSFRVMVGIGVLMLAVAWWCSLRLYRKGELSPLQYKVLIGMSFSGWLATLAGWYVTEIGRQPYLVYGVLKTSDAVTTVATEQVALTLIMYLALYVVLLLAYVKTLFWLAKRAIEVEEYDLSLPGLPEQKAKFANEGVEA